MLTPQFLLSLSSELVIDLFAGGGGASTGIEKAIGRPVDIAINHDPEAISLHQANHPQTQHFCSDVFEVDPVAVCKGQPVGMLWASPDCKHFSKAKGGKPVSKKIRSLAGVVVKWIEKLKPTNQHPRMIFLENVEEFKTWGPLGADNRPCPHRKGQTFQRWVRSIEKLGYVVEHRELRACDYGAPTIRKRLFLVARRDGIPIVWPKPSHADPKVEDLRNRKRGEKRMPAWRTAAECIDWSIPAPSIFERKKDLAEATCKRIAKGLMRYVIEAKDPFIVPTSVPFLTEHANASSPRVFPANEPLRTQCANVKGGHFSLVVPTLVQTGYGEREGQAPRALDIGKPIGTLVGSQKHALVTAFMTKFNTGSTGFAVDTPMHTIIAGGEQKRPGTAITQGIVTANLVHYHSDKRDGDVRASTMCEPIKTQTTENRHALVTSNLIKLRGTNVGSATNEPVHTISAQGTHHAEVRAFLIKYYGNEKDGVSLADPMHTLPTRDRMGLVTVKGEEYAIVDIGLRMLTPRELFTAQGFDSSYQIDFGADGAPVTKTAQVRMCGNSVCPPLSQAIVGVNYSEVTAQRKAA